MANAFELDRARKDGGTAASGADVRPTFAVKHYTVNEIAELWSLSDDAVRKIFEKEPGVLLIADQKPRIRRRRYTTLRIPEFVVERVHRRLSKV
jgi:hypothetical protein